MIYRYKALIESVYAKDSKPSRKMIFLGSGNKARKIIKQKVNYINIHHEEILPKESKWIVTETSNKTEVIAKSKAIRYELFPVDICYPTKQTKEIV